MIVLLVVELVSCNIMEMSPVRLSHNDSIASCRTSFLQYNGDVASALLLLRDICTSVLIVTQGIKAAKKTPRCRQCALLVIFA